MTSRHLLTLAAVVLVAASVAASGRPALTLGIAGDRMTINGDDSEGSPVLTAECVHCHPELLPDGATSYLSGFMFTGTPGDEAERQIFDLLDTATSAASY